MTLYVAEPYILGIPAYWFWAGIGFAAAFCCALLLMVREDIPVRGKLSFLPWAAAGAVGGAKLFGVLTVLAIALGEGQDLGQEILSGSGLVFYGGLLGYLLAIWAAVRRREGRADGPLLDALFLPIPLFHSFARLGCLFAGCCYGMPWRGPLSVVYAMGPGAGPARFPVQLAEAAAELAIFALLLRRYLQGRTGPPGGVVWRYLLCYAPARFLLELLRGDPARGVFGPLSFSQVVSILILLILPAKWACGRYYRERGTETV